MQWVAYVRHLQACARNSTQAVAVAAGVLRPPYVTNRVFTSHAVSPTKDVAALHVAIQISVCLSVAGKYCCTKIVILEVLYKANSSLL